MDLNRLCCGISCEGGLKPITFTFKGFLFSNGLGAGELNTLGTGCPSYMLALAPFRSAPPLSTPPLSTPPLSTPPLSTENTFCCLRMEESVDLLRILLPFSTFDQSRLLLMVGCCWHAPAFKENLSRDLPLSFPPISHSRFCVMLSRPQLFLRYCMMLLTVWERRMCFPSMYSARQFLISGKLLAQFGQRSMKELNGEGDFYEFSSTLLTIDLIMQGRLPQCTFYGSTEDRSV